MPGASLWLLPPDSHPLNKALSELINHTLPAHFSSHPGDQAKFPNFVPHVTLISGIDLSALPKDPQSWLSELKFPVAEDVHVRLMDVRVGTRFTKKLFLGVSKGRAQAGQLGELCKVCRLHGVESPAGFSGWGSKEESAAEQWVENMWDPHVSLLYSNIEVPEDGRVAVETLVREAGVRLQGDEEMAGWQGGRVWLVPTDLKIDEWKPVAERTLH